MERVYHRERSQSTRQAELRKNAVSIPYAVAMVDHYNRLARLAGAHVPVTVEVNIQTAFTGDKEHGFNAIAEIPGPVARKLGTSPRPTLSWFRITLTMSIVAETVGQFRPWAPAIH